MMTAEVNMPCDKRLPKPHRVLFGVMDVLVFTIASGLPEPQPIVETHLVAEKLHSPLPPTESHGWSSETAQWRAHESAQEAGCSSQFVFHLRHTARVRKQAYLVVDFFEKPPRFLGYLEA